MNDNRRVQDQYSIKDLQEIQTEYEEFLLIRSLNTIINEQPMTSTGSRVLQPLEAH